MAVTYLNRGSCYALSIQDTLDGTPYCGRGIYCTTVQVLFDSEEQRHNPAKYWLLWDQSRGSDKSHVVEGRFQAIKYVECLSQDQRKPLATLSAVHSDGFSLTWSQDNPDLRNCLIKFQMNFLSTDFSHAKGSNGAVMRLCCRTEEVSSSSLLSPLVDRRMMFCKIKLFRSHGAERKMVNDIANVEHRIQRIERQIARSSPRKSLRADSNAKENGENLPRKVKRKRVYCPDGLQSRIQALRDSLTSNKKFSILDQLGSQQENFDWYPTRTPTFRPHQARFEDKQLPPGASRLDTEAGCPDQQAPADSLTELEPREEGSSLQSLQPSTQPLSYCGFQRAGLISTQ